MRENITVISGKILHSSITLCAPMTRFFKDMTYPAIFSISFERFPIEAVKGYLIVYKILNDYNYAWHCGSSKEM